MPPTTATRPPPPGPCRFASPALTWAGNLEPGDTATVTFSVTVHSPDTSDHILASTVTSATAGSNCAAGSTDPRCAVTVPVALLRISGWNVATATPGSVIRFTVTLANAGKVAYTGITMATDLSGVFDNATSNGDRAATSGSITVTATGASWTGSIPAGGTVIDDRHGDGE